MPKLGVDPERWGEDQERHAFTLAEDTEGVVLEKVQDALARILATGEGAGRGKDIVQEILDAAGISPRSPGYAENVFRTNMMDAYNTGSHREMQDPDVKDFFPAWKYIGIHDGRQRPAHEVHFGHYFPNGVSFAEVRDKVKGSFDGFQCRRASQPIDRYEWEDLQNRGAVVKRFAEE